MSAALWFPNAHGASSFSQAHAQTSLSQDEQDNWAPPAIVKAAPRRRSSTQMQRTPPPAPQQHPLQPLSLHPQPQAAPSNRSTPLPPMHPMKLSTPSPMQPQQAGVSSALKAARARLSASSLPRSAEVSPSSMINISMAMADKENGLLRTPQQNKQQLGDYLSPLRFPGSGQSTPSGNDVVKPARFSISTSPLVVSLAEQPNQLKESSEEKLVAVPLAWSTPVRPVLGAARRQSQGASIDPRVSAMKERVAATLLKSKQKAQPVFTPAHPRSFPAMAAPTPVAAPIPSVDEMLSPMMAAVNLTPYSQATEQAVTAAMEEQAWASLLDKSTCEDIPLIPDSSSIELQQEATPVTVEEPAKEDVAMELAPVAEQEEEEESVPAVPVSAPKASSWAPPSPADIVEMLSGVRKSRSPVVAAPIRMAELPPSPAPMPTVAHLASFSPATVIKRERAQYSLDLIASITSPAQSIRQAEMEVAEPKQVASPAPAIAQAPAAAVIAAAVPSKSFGVVRFLGLIVLLGAIGFGALYFHLLSTVQIQSEMRSFVSETAVKVPVAVEQLIELPILTPQVQSVVVEEAMAAGPVEVAPTIVAQPIEEILISEIIAAEIELIETPAIAEEVIETPVAAAPIEIVEAATEAPVVPAIEIVQEITQEIVPQVVEAPVETEITVEAVEPVIAVAPVEEAVVPSEPTLEQTFEVPVDAEPVESGEVVTKWIWSPDAVMGEEDLFAMPFVLGSAFGAEGQSNVPTIIVHAPIQAPVATVEAPAPQMTIIQSTPRVAAPAAAAPAPVVPVAAPVAAPIVAPVQPAVPVIEPEEKQAVVEIVEAPVVEAPAVIIAAPEIKVAEIAVVEPAAVMAVESVVESVAVVETVAEPIVEAVSVVEVAAIVEPVVAPVATAPVSAVSAPSTGYSWAGTAFFVVFIAVSILGALLQSMETAAAVVPVSEETATQRSSSASRQSGSFRNATPSASATTPGSRLTVSPPFSFAAVPAVAASLPQSSKRVSLSPIKTPIRKIHFSPGSAERSRAVLGAAAPVVKVTAPTPAPFEAMTARLESTTSAVQAMRANIEKATAAAAVAAAASKPVRAPRASPALHRSVPTAVVDASLSSGARLHVDVPMQLAARPVRAAAASASSLAVPSALESVPEVAAAAVAPKTVRASRASRASTAVVAEPTPAPERRVTRRSTRVG